MNKIFLSLMIIILARQVTFAQTVTDIDGNVYNTVIIGTQKWLQQDLKATRFSNGDSIPDVKDTIQWCNMTSPAYCNYQNLHYILSDFGRLYNWFAASDSRNVCPLGYHVSTDNDWVVLTNFLGYQYVAGGKLKEAGTTHWYSPNEGADNSSGFTALPGGYRGVHIDLPWEDTWGRYNGRGFAGCWWTTLDAHDSLAYCRILSYDETQIQRIYYLKRWGYSIRCVCDTLTSQINKYNENEQINIFPNPFNQSTQIALNKTYHNITVEMYDLQGQLVFQNQYADCSNIFLHKGRLINGLYFIKLILDESATEIIKIAVSD